MRYLLFTDTSQAAVLVSEAAEPGESVAILCADRNLARRLRRRGHDVAQVTLSRPSTWKRHLRIEDAELLVVVSLERQGEAVPLVRELGGLAPDLPIVLLDSRHQEEGEAPEVDDALDELPNVERVRLTDIVRAPFQEQFANAFVRRRVRQYREHFKDADRVVILLHDEPDPDGIASALALRVLLRRNKQTTTIGCFKAPTRPENLRMLELLGIDVKEITEDDLSSFDRVAVVDTQPHIFGGKLPHADLVIDHHPPRTGYTATFKDIRTSFGATCTLLLDHLLRAGLTISERLATAAVYAIKTDTWTFRRGTLAADIAIFAHVFSRADQAVLRRIEGEGFTLERLRLIGEVAQNYEMVGRFIYSHLGAVPRDDFVPTTADLLLEPAETHWSAVSGVVDDTLTISVRNLGYQRSAGELVQQVYGEMGSAGGHRSAAKAIIPLERAVREFGDPEAPGFAKKVFKPLWEAAGEK